MKRQADSALPVLRATILTVLCAVAFGTSAYVRADEQVYFRDIVAQGSAGIDYRRGKSPDRDALYDAIKARSILRFQDTTQVPMKPRGLPGIAIFDFDQDGDEDIYVTNGPGVGNSLYSSQLMETGQLVFIDVAEQAGVAANDMDSTGVCYGDIDNDGDKDLYVLGTAMPNRLFRNQGNGKFVDISEAGHIGAGDDTQPSGCAMGDVNGDGLLDIVIGNTWSNWDDRIELFVAIGDIEHNQLFINIDGKQFKDVSDESGIRNLAGFIPELEGTAGITWGIAMVDYDLDGDVDILFADDQGLLPTAANGGVDRGLIHVMQNDGTGKFVDVAVEAGIGVPGAWMGFSFGDVNSDGYMDVFATNAGDYIFTMMPSSTPYELGSFATRFFLGQADGSFSDPGVGDLVSSFFGWGTVMADYDNDGDTDIIYHGGQDVGAFVETAPGVILANDGSGNFRYDTEAMSASTDHVRRNVQGVAAGDLNNDGFVDIVSVSNFDYPVDFPLAKYDVQWGTVTDDFAYLFPSYFPTGIPGEFRWSGLEPVDGTLSVEINSGDNGQNWAGVELMGTAGLVSEGVANRDGIGAVVNFTPHGGKTVMRPVLGGSSFLSQNSLKLGFGLGEARKGTVDVLWPGGVRNRFYGLKAGESLRLPEIPCSYDAEWKSKRAYKRCVAGALRQLQAAEKIDHRTGHRLYRSAIRAFREERKTPGNG